MVDPIILDHFNISTLTYFNHGFSWYLNVFGGSGFNMVQPSSGRFHRKADDTVLLFFGCCERGLIGAPLFTWVRRSVCALLRAQTSAGWWFGCHFLFSRILGISSSQLTFIFFRGVAQPPTSIGLGICGGHMSMLPPSNQLLRRR